MQLIHGDAGMKFSGKPEIAGVFPASIDILKGASTANHGTRGAAGVAIIKLK